MTTAKAERYSGPFLEPVDGVMVSCPEHGVIGRATLGAKMFCAACHTWFDSVKQAGVSEGRLLRKQEALRKRMAKKRRRAGSSFL
jgi:hypothetical protein